MSKHILVVDDEPDVIELLKDILEDAGYTVRSAEDGRVAYESILEEKPDLILLDIQMPRQTGADLFRRLRNQKELRDIPVIVISGIPSRRLAVSRDVPVLDKPVEEELLLSKVRELLP